MQQVSLSLQKTYLKPIGLGDTYKMHKSFLFFHRIDFTKLKLKLKYLLN